MYLLFSEKLSVMKKFLIKHLKNISLKLIQFFKFVKKYLYEREHIWILNLAYSILYVFLIRIVVCKSNLSKFVANYCKWKYLLFISKSNNKQMEMIEINSTILLQIIR